MKNSAIIAIHITANDERQMRLHKVQSDDKTQFRVRLRYLPNKYVLGCSPPHLISKSAKSKRSNIRGKIHRMDLAQCQFHILSIDISSSNRVSRAMFLHLLRQLRRERTHCGLKSITSYDTTEEATTHVYNMDMFVQRGKRLFV